MDRCFSGSLIDGLKPYNISNYIIQLKNMCSGDLLMTQKSDTIGINGIDTKDEYDNGK